MLNILLVHILLMMLAVQASASETSLLPYIPTTIFVPGSSTGIASGRGTDGANSTAYIFTPGDGGSVELLSLDISSSVDSSSVSSSAKTLSSGLPFLSPDSNSTTFTPTFAADGSIVVYAGDCSSDTGSSVWIYNTTSSQPSWVQHSITESAGATTGPYILGGGLSYSETISPTLSPPMIYSYGGQCPDASLNGTTWTSAADYSHSMTRLTPSAGSPSSMHYTAETLSLGSQPVAEAGFSFTYLPPSTSNISGTVTQSLNSVVLGGHTQSAFVNMSTAAVWSLPEESWSFISISGPSASSSSDIPELAKNDEEATSVQPRSGHTAVLNEGGTVLIILGGWVGNTSQAAQPQLAVLEMSDSVFGEWTWSVPDNQPLTNGEGVYGHGAALLPGDVMMVAGGYAISSSSSGSSGNSLGKRGDIDVASGLQMFFNLTSQTWSDTYTNPLSTSTGSGSESTGTPLSFYTRLGLGLGLGLGIPILFMTLAVCFFCYRRKQRLRHSVRDEHTRNLTAGTAFITSDEMLERGNEHGYPWGPNGAARWYYTGGHDPYLRDAGRSMGYENLRGQSGARPDFDDPMAVEAAGGHRRDIRRKSAPRVARGLYQPTGVDGMDDGPGAIHPILEDEEDEIAMPSAISPDRDEGTDDHLFNMTSPLTPTAPGGAMQYVSHEPSGSGPPSPTETRPPARVQPQHPDVQDWVSEIDASGALINARLQPRSATIRTVGKVSPTRRPSVRASEDEGVGGTGTRTDSNLSESNRSAFSFIMSRSDSLRAAGAGWLGAGKPRNEQERGGTSHSDNSNSGNSGNSEATQGSYATAKSIPALQAEGPGLLLGRPRPISDIEDLGHISDDDPLTPGSPSKSKAPRRSWFGSLKRVFSGGTGSGSSNEGSSRTESPTHGQSSDFDGLGLGSLGLGGIGLLQKRRQGKSAWGEAGPSGSGGAQGEGDGWEEGEDWDIEKAVENRLVQVMFSVPKDRLRVVNADADLVSLEESAVLVDPERDEVQPSPVSATEEAVSGKGKGKEQETTNEKEGGETLDDVASQSEEVGKGKQPERQSMFLEVPQRPVSLSSEDSRRRSISPVVMMAEAVKFERPKTRVLEMVEGFEERSRSNSPVEKATSLKSSLSSRSARSARS